MSPNEHIIKIQGSAKEIRPINEAESVNDTVSNSPKDKGIYEGYFLIDYTNDDLR